MGIRGRGRLARGRLARGRLARRRLGRIHVGERCGRNRRSPGACGGDGLIDTAPRRVVGGGDVGLCNTHSAQLLLGALDGILAADVFELAGIPILLRIAFKMPAHPRGLALDQEWTAASPHGFDCGYRGVANGNDVVAINTIGWNPESLGKL